MWFVNSEIAVDKHKFSDNLSTLERELNRSKEEFIKKEHDFISFFEYLRPLSSYQKDRNPNHKLNGNKHQHATDSIQYILPSPCICQNTLHYLQHTKQQHPYWTIRSFQIPRSHQSFFSIATNKDFFPSQEFFTSTATLRTPLPRNPLTSDVRLRGNAKLGFQAPE